ncbi:MAG: mannosyl-3-phosphoglycerate phosphatase [Crocinitomicaceae bacterium]|jgi:mannosyl-3-phosphoglycerate phosphatase
MMSDKSLKLLVVTDLDSSLLDEDYGYTGAVEALRCLQDEGCPLVLNSSKTYAELRELAADLSRCDAVIAENGGLVAIRQGASILPSGEVDRFGFVPIRFGMARERILELAHTLRKNDGYAFEGFSDWSVDQVIEHTGLDRTSAALAMERETSEPILWRGSENEMDDFKEKLQHLGIRVLRGGRFFHLMGMVDKVQGMQLVVDRYKVAEPMTDWLVVAVGDSANDKAMLEAADRAIVIPHASGPMVHPENGHTLIANNPGSIGWGQAILQTLKHT